MHLPRYSIVSVLLLALVFGGFPSEAGACSCAPPPPLEEAFEQASAVFIGQVVSTGRSALRPQQQEVRFRIAKEFKGGLEALGLPDIPVYTPANSAMCGFDFSKGLDYLVFATGNPASLRTSICSRTVVLERAKREDLKLLESLKAGK